MIDSARPAPPHVPRFDDPDDAWANAAHISAAGGFLTSWPRRAARWRAAHPPGEVVHGPHPRERTAIYPADGTSRGLAVIVHGGYWMRFSPDDFSHLAAGAVACGWTVAMPGYPLCPDAGVGAICTSICRAIERAADRVPGPIHLAGHSAGGQLVAYAGCRDSPLAAAVAARLASVLSVSGVHDLMPLLQAGLNDTLGLDEVQALALSPARLAARPGPRWIACAGAHERPEFLRQNALLGAAWSTSGIDVETRVEPGRHHFDIIEGLCEPDSSMIGAWLAGRREAPPAARQGGDGPART